MILGSTILEIAIGLFFVYLLLALLSSALNEWLAELLELRARTLRQGIRQLLTDPVILGLAERFYTHPLITKLTAPDHKQGPSYIGTRTFATALLDLLPIRDGSTGSQTPLESFQRLRAALLDYQQQGSPLGHILLQLIDQAGITPTQIAAAESLRGQAEQARLALAQLAAGPAPSPGAEIIQPLLEQVQALEMAYQRVEAEVNMAISRAQVSIELYFDQAMERVSGAYRRYVQWILLVIALCLTVLLNADTLALINALATDEDTRAQVLAAAIDATGQAAQANSGTALVTGAGTSTLEGTASLTDTLSSLSGDALAILDGLPLPLGWTQESMPEGWGWLTKILGLLVTALAAAMGAPFWFDLLDRLVNVRLTGQPPAPPVPAAGLPSMVIPSGMMPPAIVPARVVTSALEPISPTVRLDARG